jgi:ADP-heptose:LPS heptosyltransferase
MVLAPKKILLCNNAYRGDVILATSMLSFFKKKFNDVKIGMVVSSEGKAVIEDHVLVDYIHVFDHPLLNRSNLNKKEKKIRGSDSFLKALKEIKSISYDIAIDQYSIFKPSSKSLIFKSDIPIRIGWFAFDNCLYYNWLIPLPDNDLHMLKKYEEMLKALGATNQDMLYLKTNLDYKSSFSDVLLPKKFEKEGYILIHPSSFDPIRCLDVKFWRKLSSLFERENLNLIFVGKGIDESNKINLITQNISHTLSLCNNLYWQDLLDLIKKAKGVIAVESMVGHIAAHFDVPLLSIYGGYYPVKTWQPYQKSLKLVLPPLQYFNKLSKTPSTAIKLIDEEIVFKEFMELLYDKKIS